MDILYILCSFLAFAGVYFLIGGFNDLINHFYKVYQSIKIHKEIDKELELLKEKKQNDTN